ATVFEQQGALDRLQGFASEHGPRFYGLPLNQENLTLVKREQTVPRRLESTPSMQLRDAGLEASEWPVLFHGGETLSWSVQVDRQAQTN
ncbi:MAG: dihydroorotase, partial [Synechococcus sp. BS307-5m-G37]|nr:dihydroorotase [Synechococcus sp. BS307-5m-G37]